MGATQHVIQGQAELSLSSQGAQGQAELHDVVAELSDVARQREARLVGLEADAAALRLHADDLEGQLPCARDCVSELAMLTGGHTRTGVYL